MTYTKKQFLQDVAKEARALKQEAQAEELEKLDFSKLDPDSPSECIYGSMTGWCRNERAVELITKCCTRFFENSVLSALQIGVTPLFAIRKYVNGEKSHDPTRLVYVSSIETYIQSPFAKNANLIAFLKGERKDLVL